MQNPRESVISNKMEEDEYKDENDVMYTNLSGNGSMGKQPEQNHTPTPQQKPLQSTI